VVLVASGIAVSAALAIEAVVRRVAAVQALDVTLAAQTGADEDSGCSTQLGLGELGHQDTFDSSPSRSLTEQPYS
jgi:hypothetical protein